VLGKRVRACVRTYVRIYVSSYVYICKYASIYMYVLRPFDRFMNWRQCAVFMRRKAMTYAKFQW
jgi:hypothetical protein